MKDWITDDVRVYFDEKEGAFTGKLAEICDGGLFLVVEGEEYFIPWRKVTYVRHIKEFTDVHTF
jgi:hypothetical protein